LGLREKVIKIPSIIARLSYFILFLGKELMTKMMEMAKIDEFLNFWHPLICVFYYL
jgi:hypothetical protein